MYPRGFLQSPSGLPLMHEGHIRVHIPASFVASRQIKDCNYSILLINCFSWHQMWSLCIYASNDVFAADGPHLWTS